MDHQTLHPLRPSWHTERDEPFPIELHRLDASVDARLGRGDQSLSKHSTRGSLLASARWRQQKEISVAVWLVHCVCCSAGGGIVATTQHTDEANRTASGRQIGAVGSSFFKRNFQSGRRPIWLRSFTAISRRTVGTDRFFFEQKRIVRILNDILLNFF